MRSLALGAIVLCTGMTLFEGATLGEPSAAQIVAPVAVRKPIRATVHGIERLDDYAWLRDPNWREVLQDPSRLSPEIRNYIDAENNHSNAILGPLANLRAKLVKEMKGRMEQYDSEVPLFDGPYAYWSRSLPGAEHAQLMRSARDGSAEQVLLDGTVLSEGKAYFAFGFYMQSPDHRHFAYLTDETGSETFTLRILDTETKRDLPEIIPELAGFAWSDATTLYYVRLDSEHRGRLIYRHQLGTDPLTDKLVHEEKDASFSFSVSRTSTGRYVMITTSSFNTSETWLVDSLRPNSEPFLVAAREVGTEYYVDDWGDRFLVRTNADGATDFKLVTAPYSAPSRNNWVDIVPAKAGRQVISTIPFADYLVALEREEGLQQLTIYRKSDGAAQAITIDEEAYSIELVIPFEFNTSILRFRYSSPARPWRTFDHDMTTQERVLRKEQTVPSGHDPLDYVVRRLFATTTDNEQVPITVLHRKDLVLNGEAPLFLEGYGGYAFAFETPFNSGMLSLVDRGFVYAIAHVRGGLEKGERWHLGGSHANKPNVFNDFIAVAEHLISSGYSSSGRIVARGDSNGGLLMGAVANMRPELFAGMIARVPYVDLLNTFLDDTLPLTSSGFTEFGNPMLDVNVYRSIASYAPYEQVRAQAYPHMLVTAGLSDSRVQYWEPAKWVAKLRAMKTNNARIALVTSTSGGHFGPAGRFEWLEELSLIQAFSLDALGMVSPEERTQLLEPSGLADPSSSRLQSPRPIK